MDWFPNRDALEYFVRAIFPLVQKEVPGVRLIAAGRNPSPEFRARFADVSALEFTGTLPDLRPVIAKAAVCVVPLRIGSGTRLKILEAGAMGKAMVSTTVGAEGLDFVPGKEILIADDPAEFARNVVELLRDPARRKAIGEAARHRVLQDYDVTALERSIAAAFQRLAAIDGQGSRQSTTRTGGLRRIGLIFYFLVIMSMPYFRHQFWDAEVGPGITVTKLLGAICLLYALAYLAKPPRHSPLFRHPASPG